jgi:hypothetical protein
VAPPAASLTAPASSAARPPVPPSRRALYLVCAISLSPSPSPYVLFCLRQVSASTTACCLLCGCVVPELYRRFRPRVRVRGLMLLKVRVVHGSGSVLLLVHKDGALRTSRQRIRLCGWFQSCIAPRIQQGKSVLLKIHTSFLFIGFHHCHRLWGTWPSV